LRKDRERNKHREEENECFHRSRCCQQPRPDVDSILSAQSIGRSAG
jgi:hypothetical protein